MRPHLLSADNCLLLLHVARPCSPRGRTKPCTSPKRLRCGFNYDVLRGTFFLSRCFFQPRALASVRDQREADLDLPSVWPELASSAWPGWVCVFAVPPPETPRSHRRCPGGPCAHLGR